MLEYFSLSSLSLKKAKEIVLTTIVDSSEVNSSVTFSAYLKRIVDAY